MITLEQDADSAIISVRDYGPGVPEDMLGKITQPFFQGDKHQGGVGLGLALVQNIMGASSGTLELKNVSPGLEAQVFLPRVSDQGLRDTAHV